MVRERAIRSISRRSASSMCRPLIPAIFTISRVRSSCSIRDMMYSVVEGTPTRSASSTELRPTPDPKYPPKRTCPLDGVLPDAGRPSADVRPPSWPCTPCDRRDLRPWEWARCPSVRSMLSTRPLGRSFFDAIGAIVPAPREKCVGPSGKSGSAAGGICYSI